MLHDRDFILHYLEKYFDEVTPKEFYRAIFPIGELGAHDERETKGKYQGIALEILPTEDLKGKVKRYLITDELDILDKLQKSNNFIITSPISYAGRSRKAENARYIYGIAIDYDGIEELHYLADFFHQVTNGFLPRPTYTVFSGQGCHLYYIFEKAIPCYKNITKQVAALKHELTKKIWNSFTTALYEQPQYQSWGQGFRLVGSCTKAGGRVRAFETGKKVDIEYLNTFVDEKYQLKEVKYKSKLTLAEAKAKYPEWYEKRIIKKEPVSRGHWICKEDLYNWWLKRLKAEIKVHHRYFGIMCLAIYAKKSGISREQLEIDAFSLLEHMENMTIEEGNHFTESDIIAALELYNDDYFTFPIDTITKLTQIPIEKNKRNYRKQALHLQRARAVQAIDYPNGEWRNKKGKGVTKDKIVIEWQKQHPKGKVIDCARDTGLSRTTIYKYWNKGE